MAGPVQDKAVAVLMSTVLKTQLRPMSMSDLPVVMAIEEDSYEFPWTEGIFRDCLRNHYQCWVYESGGRILAYAVMSVGIDECHLLNICVDAVHRGQGIGSHLIEQMLGLARRLNMRMAFLEVRCSNTDAYRLYLRHGFNEIGVRRNYYPASGGREDALVLAYDFASE